jgi:hypothetical protein
VLTLIGIRRNIKYTWAFMLLGQIVAISFATNLFLLTLLLSPTAPRISTPRAQRSSWLAPWLLNLASVLATVIPAFLLANDHYWHHSKDFLPVLLVPHVALLVVPFLRAVVPERYFPEDGVAVDDKLWALTLGNAAIMLLKTTYTAVSYGGFGGIRNALLEHPAVSSVGFDVVFCWITWICWVVTQGQSVRSIGERSTDKAE